MLFWVASGTDWVKAGVTHAAAQHMVVRNLVERAYAPTRLELTPQGHEVLAALLGRG